MKRTYVVRHRVEAVHQSPEFLGSRNKVPHHRVCHTAQMRTHFAKMGFLATTPLVSIFVLDRKGNWFWIQREKERQESLCRAAEPEEKAIRQHGYHVNHSYKRPKKI